MRYFYLLFRVSLVSFLTMACPKFDPSKKISLKDFKLSGKVEKVDQYVKDSLVSSFKFNKVGNLMESIRYQDEKPIEKKIFKYDAKVRLMRTEYYDDKFQLDKREIFKYDDKNALRESVFYDKEENLMGREIFEYDKKKLMKIDFFNSKDQLKGRKEIRYNSDRALSEINIYDKINELESKEVFKYDDKKKLIETNFFDSKEKLRARSILEYDDRSNVIEKTISSYLEDGNLDYKIIIGYDDKENIKKTSTYDSKKKLISHVEYTYVFDLNSNWTSRIEVEKIEKKELVLNSESRLISYH